MLAPAELSERAGHIGRQGDRADLARLRGGQLPGERCGQEHRPIVRWSRPETSDFQRFPSAAGGDRTTTVGLEEACFQGFSCLCGTMSSLGGAELGSELRSWGHFLGHAAALALGLGVCLGLGRALPLVMGGSVSLLIGCNAGMYSRFDDTATRARYCSGDSPPGPLLERGPKMRRACSTMGMSLMLASRRVMRPCSLNSQSSLP